MIRTQETKIPWLWVLIMVLPAFADRMVGMISQTFMAFTLDKFTKNAALVMFFGSANVLFHVIISPYVAWKSDRIWTRFGRRKPFCIVGWLGCALFVFLIPNAPSLYTASAAIIGYCLFIDLVMGGAWEPLYMEVIPQPLRGRAGAIRKGMVLLTALFVNLTLMRVYDHSYPMHFGSFNFTITGEHITYYTIASAVVAIALLIGFSVKEIRPETIPNLNERFAIGAYLGSIFRDRQQLKVYSLIFAMAAMQLGLGPLSALLLNKQFGYSKAELGVLFSWLKVIQIVAFLPLAGYLADRFDRLKMFIVGITLSTLYPLLYWMWIQFVAVDNIPSKTAIICFSGFDIIVDFTVLIAMHPLIFDYVPKARMGTVYAGMGIVSSLAKFSLMNVVGATVALYAKYFNNGVNDYSAGFLCMFVLGVLGTMCALYFMRERRLGRVIPYGKIEHEAAVAARKAAAAQAQDPQLVGQS